MNVGTLYLIRFNRHTGSKWELVEAQARYLGKTQWGEHQFDFRPLAGTTTLEHRYLDSVTPLAHGEVMLPREVIR